MLPVTRFLEFIHRNQLFLKSEKVLLAVSGGRDSVLMVHLFNEANLDFGIAHCNFGLRGQESDEDEAFVRELASTIKVPFITVRFATTAFAEENGISIQMAARELRYNWFEEMRIKHGYRYIAVAHHQSDATETILLNLVRGTGISGLHGIRPKRMNIIRPLLFLSSDEIRDYISGNGIRFREDSSNSSVKYARNKIRLAVVPHLRELNAQLDETFAANSRRFEEIEEFLNTHIESLRHTLFETGSAGEMYIPIERLKALTPRKLLLFELFKPYNFGEPVLEDLVKAWDGQPGKKFESPTHTLLLDRHQLILKKNDGLETPMVLVEAQKEAVHWKHLYLKSRYASMQGLVISTRSDTAFFDAHLLQFPLKLRLWKKGDFFYPFGMKGKKKVSDFFTSLKLSLFSKENVPVLENGNGDILWIVGFRTDDRYKITPRTNKVFILENLNTHEQQGHVYRETIPRKRL